MKRGKRRMENGKWRIKCVKLLNYFAQVEFDEALDLNIIFNLLPGLKYHFCH